MADNKQSRRSFSDDGGPQEEGDRVKTKPVSCSTVGGKGVPVKRTSQLLTPEDEDESSDQPAPSKASKIGFSMSSKMATKSNPISIKLGASKPKEPVPSAPPKKLASVFDEDDDVSSQITASKIGFGMNSKMATKSNPISIKLGASKPKEPVPSAPPKKLASVFDEDDDSEPEEMPPEAKMRMKNIGRETPTSAGPNSFNKGKQGFSDNQKLWERKMKTQPENS